MFDKCYYPEHVRYIIKIKKKFLLQEGIIMEYKTMLEDGHIVEYTDEEMLVKQKEIRAKVPYTQGETKPNVYKLLGESKNAEQLMSRAIRASNSSFFPDFQPCLFADILESKLELLKDTPEMLELAQVMIYSLKNRGCILPKCKMIYNAVSKAAV